MADRLKQNIPWQSEFSHRYACWANNHMGWAKMKKFNRRLAKSRLKQQVQREIDFELRELDCNKNKFGG